MVLELVDDSLGQDCEIEWNIFSYIQYACWHLFIQLNKYIYKAGCVTDRVLNPTFLGITFPL